MAGINLVLDLNANWRNKVDFFAFRYISIKARNWDQACLDMPKEAIKSLRSLKQKEV